MPVYVIIQRGAIEGYYSAPCGIALTAAGAQKWIDDTVARALRLKTAHTVGRDAVAAWEAKNPDLFTDPSPTLTKWPSGVGQKDPRYAELRAQRDHEQAAIQAWATRRESAVNSRRVITDNVFQQAITSLDLSPDEVQNAMQNARQFCAEASDYYVEVWHTVEEDPTGEH